MTKVLKKVPTNSRTIAVNDKQMMFHVPTTSLFELDELSAQLIEAADSESGLSVDKLTQSLSAQTAKDIDDTVEQLIQLKVVASHDAGVQAFEPDNPEVTQLENIPLTTLVLNVNTGCNLSCS
ncbi:MAG TPA: quinohemoprotein amine dehydrogenase maturase, partial [Alteromonas macleodii]|nr:quinohemoprotein amine dehydrogenase maturase [Alteromonas macleodii]